MIQQGRRENLSDWFFSSFKKTVADDSGELPSVGRVSFTSDNALPAGDKRSGPKVMQRIELAIIKLPASLDKGSLISGSRDDFPKQRVIFF